VDPGNHYLYYVEGGGKALRYGVAVGGEGFGWSGVAKVHSKQEWPDWYPTGDILVRHPELRTGIKQLQSGEGIPGGPDSPMGARALYLWQGNKDTLYTLLYVLGKADIAFEAYDAFCRNRPGKEDLTV
jgi:lipoprotein-anchoring transpeptidase ErfK/SrfK